MIDAIVGIIINHSKDKVLLLKRQSDKINPNMWAPVGAGPYSTSEDFGSKAKEEVRIETGLKVSLLLVAPSMQIDIAGKTYNLHPFLFEASENESVRLNEEHSESRWVLLSRLQDPEYDPRLQMIIKLVKLALGSSVSSKT